MASVTFDGVTKVFRDGTVAVRDLDLIVEEGELFVLLGASGSYIAALRASRRRVMRTKLLPESVDRAIARSRDHAFERVRRRFKKTGTE